MTKGTASIVVVVLALIFLGIFAMFSYLAPQRTLQSIQDAVQVNDTEGLSELVDFDSVRSLLKEDLKAMTASTANTANTAHSKSESSIMALLGVKLSSEVIDTVVDTLITPAGLINIASEWQFGQDISTSTSYNDSNDPKATQPKADDASKTAKLLVEGHYEGLSRYIYSIRYSNERPEDGASLFLRRDGIFKWKLTRMAAPKRILSHYFASGGAGDSREQTTYIEIQESDLSQISTNELKLTATIANRADFAQNYPLIELTLTDAQDLAVARRVLTPSDYLGSKGELQFAADSSRRFELSILCELKTVGYRLYIFYSSNEPDRLLKQISPTVIKVLPANTSTQM